MKIFSYQENVRKYFTRINFTTKIFPRCLAPCYTQLSTSPIAAAHISSSHSVIFFSINAHHTRLVKLFLSNLVCTKIILCESFFDKNLLDEKKVNYGKKLTERFVCCMTFTGNSGLLAMNLKDDDIRNGGTYSSRYTKQLTITSSTTNCLIKFSSHHLNSYLPKHQIYIASFLGPSPPPPPRRYTRA